MKHQVAIDFESEGPLKESVKKVARDFCEKAEYRTYSSWWFQPIWKILAKLDHFPK